VARVYAFKLAPRKAGQFRGRLQIGKGCFSGGQKRSEGGRVAGKNRLDWRGELPGWAGWFAGARVSLVRTSDWEISI